ncbi:MAG: PfkB family carbohydrate kinase [Bacteroidota bacterium]
MVHNNNRQVFGLGETVFDVVFKNGKPIAGHPGGSTFNCMISLGRCGINGAFISETGNDHIGDITIKLLEDNDLSGEYVNRFSNGKSALSLAFLDEKNDAEYDYYKDYPNQRLQLELPEIKKDDIVVFGSFIALNEAVRPFVKKFVEYAHSAGAIIYYDPNYRDKHVHKLENLMPTLTENFKLSTIVRGSDEDFQNIYKTSSIEKVYNNISEYCPNLIYTANSKAVKVKTKNHELKHKVPNIQPISTVGAGDSFNAGIVYSLIKNNIGIDDIPGLQKESWDKMIQTAISFSTEVCMSYENYVSKGFAKKLLSKS